MEFESCVKDGFVYHINIHLYNSFVSVFKILHPTVSEVQPILWYCVDNIKMDLKNSVYVPLYMLFTFRNFTTIIFLLSRANQDFFIPQVNV